ncbi:hypothetical protein ACKKBG_A03170 [Auxenochlorella protothecoides x Auxenochlorella symbiontica]
MQGLDSPERASHASPLSPRSTAWRWLGEHPDDAAELAALLHEAAPKLGLKGDYPVSRRVTPSFPAKTTLRRDEADPEDLGQLLQQAVPIPTGLGMVPWKALRACCTSEQLHSSGALPAQTAAQDSAGDKPVTPRGASALEINSGGLVFFCLFNARDAHIGSCSPRQSPPPSPGPESSEEALRAAAESALAEAAANGRLSPPCTDAGPREVSPSVIEVIPGANAPLAVAKRSAPHGCLVLKIPASRLQCQSELFAGEVARHVGLACPDGRILRQFTYAEDECPAPEWAAMLAAAQSISGTYPELHAELQRCSCVLVMEFIPAVSIATACETGFLGPKTLARVSHDLGRMLCLDMMLGNADRLPIEALGWRGNLGNVLFARTGRWVGRMVAIDAVVQRRPPGRLVCTEDEACERLAELALNDAELAGAVLGNALSITGWREGEALDPAAIAAFQQGLRTALESLAAVKGLFEMMYEVVRDWMDEFLADMESSFELAAATPPRALISGGSGVEGRYGGGGGPGPGVTAPSAASGPSGCSPSLLASPGAGAGATAAATPSGSRRASALVSDSPSADVGLTTQKIRHINQEAQHNHSVSRKVAAWRDVFRARGSELRGAVEEWQQKRDASGSRLTTGFLDGVRPVVDVYELKVRLEHMLQRLRVLQVSLASARPLCLLPGLYLSDAVGASSMHTLRHLGITHILNATEDLLGPDEGLGAAWIRCALRDVEEEDITPHIEAATAFIDGARAGGGRVLVHCHAGRSRSCSLILAWMMQSQGWSLRQGMRFLTRLRPEAAPNAGYMAALLRLEEQLFGKQTVKGRKPKPGLKTCPECGQKVGLSQASVTVHLRRAHPLSTCQHLLARSGGSETSATDSESLLTRSSLTSL